MVDERKKSICYMKGSIQKCGDSHRISVELPRGEDGKRRRYYETVSSTRRRDAERKLAELITDINNQRFVEPSQILLAEYLRQWLRDYGASNVRPKTLVGYTGVAEGHLIPKLGHIKLGDLKAMHLERFKGDQLRDGQLDGSGGFSDNGLPIGMQITGKPFAEETLFQIGHAYEQATDWHTREPNL